MAKFKCALGPKSHAAAYWIPAFAGISAEGVARSIN